ncbi:hypothetical protein GALMADRAFT_83454 [Galerina marginata CBS 339.88]|uniref:Endonuclease/exonuclease/phosphatase domain-containing protein n=1 Tax=Galerina marginata (strain CBS 339.88) TaxID=685588 RepID=A0A067TYL9_GALM3|nr:hypothetical protein GALMADRAFT_83454 [Galerina marginata CBS 339.88]
MESHKKYELTPAQLALAKSRKEKKERLAAEALAKLHSTELLSRPWLGLPVENPKIRNHRAKVFTWNLLAQCLIRRELFPTSDCLKAGQRESLIHEEICRQNADILCLQEVDRLEKLLPMLEKAGYSPHYASGRGKLHGCLIAFKNDLYSMIAEKVIFYDDLSVDIPKSTRFASSFKTRNIGYMIALRSKVDETEGAVVATTHLFWHPRYTYERIRQAGMLLREVTAFRRDLSVDRWPCIIAGDFNFSPIDPAYSLITGDSLLPSQEDTISPSLVVHASLDPTVMENAPTPPAAEDESEDDPDRVITNARPATIDDGLLTIPELVDWFSKLPTPRSAYNDGLHEARKHDNNLPTYGTRVALTPGRRGSDEPEYTSYTHFWQSVLDYIFFLDSAERPISVVGLLTPLKSPDLAPGLPQKRVSGSDHTCLVAELTW